MNEWTYDQAQEWVWIFSQQRNGPDLHVPLSLQAHYTLNPASLQTPSKSFIQNQSSALSGYPSLLLTVPARLFNEYFFKHLKKKTISEVKLTKNETYQGHFRPQNQAKHRSFRRLIEGQESLMVMTTDQLLRPRVLRGREHLGGFRVIFGDYSDINDILSMQKISRLVQIFVLCSRIGRYASMCIQNDWYRLEARIKEIFKSPPNCCSREAV